MKKNGLPVWILVWIALVLGALVVLFSNQDAVDRLMTATGLTRILYPNGKNSPLTEPVTTPSSETILVDQGTKTLEIPTPTPPPPTSPDPNIDQPSLKPAQSEGDPTRPSAPNTYRLYFLKLSPEGRMDPVSFTRELPAGATPLAATLKALLQGPTLQDKAQGALSLVPEGTKLLSLRLKDKTAVVSLSEEFEHNISGLEGLAGQLREIVWTATQFQSVDSVQILINGQYRDSLGEGGISIAAPLTRSNVP